MPQSALEHFRQAKKKPSALDQFRAAKADPTLLERARGASSQFGRSYGGAMVDAAEGLATILAKSGQRSADYETPKVIGEAAGSARGFLETINPIPQSVQDQPEGLTRTLTLDLPGAAGSTAGLAAAGMLGGVGVGAGTAMLAQGGGAYREAKEAGASDDQALTALVANLPVGALDVIPGSAVTKLVKLRKIGKALTNVNKRSGGALGKFLTSTAIEGGQEGAQTYLENLIAKHVAGYDEDRDAFEGVGKSALLGAIIGGGAAGVETAANRLAPQAAQEAPGSTQPQEAPQAQPQPELTPEASTSDARGPVAAVLPEAPTASPEEWIAAQLQREAATGEVVPEVAVEGPAVAEVSPPVDQLSPATEQTAPPPFTFPAETKAQRIYSGFVHDLEPLERVERAAPVKGKGPETLAQAISLYPGRKYGERAILDAEIVNPLKKLLKASKIPAIESTPKKRSASDFLYALTHERAEKVLAEKFPNKGFDAETNPATGMKASEAKAILEETLNGPQAAVYRQIQAINRKLNKLRREVRESGGLVTGETFDDAGARVPGQAEVWESTWGPDFVPLRTEEDAENPHAYSAGFGISQRESAQRKGRSTKADSPLIFALTTLQQAIERKEANRIGNMIADLVERNPGPDARIVTSQAQIAPGEAALPYKAAGQQRWIATNHEPTAEAFKRWTDPDPGFLKLADPLLKYMHGVIIKWNPAFPPANATMDMLFSSLSHATKGDYSAAARVMVSSVPAMRGVYRVLKDENATGYWEDRFRQARKAGALVGWAEQFNFQEAARSFDLAQGWKEKASAYGRFMDRINQAAETGTRLATFDAMLRAGKTEGEAAVRSRRSTADFARHGRYGPTMRRLYLFSGAGFQGLSEFASATKSNPKRAAVVFGALVGSGYANFVLSQMYGDDDELRKLSEEQKLRHFGVMVGDRKYGVPSPRMFNVLPYIGWKFGELHMGRTTLGEMLRDVAAAIPASLSPLPQGGNELQTISPTLGRPIVELSQNRDFANRPIMKEGYDDESKARVDRYYKNVSPIAKGLAQGAYDVSGEMIDVSPEQIEHVVKFLSGGAGTFFGRSFEVMRKVAVGDSSWRVSDIPIMRTFVQQPSLGAETRIYYENKAKLERSKEREKTGKELNRIDRLYRSLALSLQDHENRIMNLRKNGQPDADIEAVRKEFNKQVDMVRREQK